MIRAMRSLSRRVFKFNHNDFDHNRKLDLKMDGGRETCLRVIFLKINSTPLKIEICYTDLHAVLTKYDFGLSAPVIIFVNC